MGAPTEYYVDPSVAADGGAGTVGSPWTRLDGNVIQYAFDNITRDATNGDRVNVKAGTPHTATTVEVSLLTYGTPNIGASLWLQGYTSTAGDGGRGTVNGSAASNTLFAAGYNYCHVHDLILHNRHASLGSYSSIVRLSLTQDSPYSPFGIAVTQQSLVIGCDISGVGTGSSHYGITLGNYSTAIGNVIDMSSNSPSGAGIRMNGNSGLAAFNIILASGSSRGILLDTHFTRAHNNSIYGNGSTGQGIHSTGISDYNQSAWNNLIEGFSGVGGIGLKALSNVNQTSYFCNSLHDNDTDVSSTADDWMINELVNESLGSSPFVNAAGGDFTPVDVGSVLSGAFASVGGHTLLNFRGAVSPVPGGGGGSVIVIED